MAIGNGSRLIHQDSDRARDLWWTTVSWPASEAAEPQFESGGEVGWNEEAKWDLQFGLDANCPLGGMILCSSLQEQAPYPLYSMPLWAALLGRTENCVTKRRLARTPVQHEPAEPHDMSVCRLCQIERGKRSLRMLLTRQDEMALREGEA
ncbi:unnamed protein product [Protopolystoma xenopodis]|uniref:Uncharacterized protein n=1 Tax=Protopolystoma xenopodis TaxID=117903 RepID=A0A3S5A8E1_9PLAT|nr:unnamed protein product [Protopolystoma xenopodis]